VRLEPEKFWIGAAGSLEITRKGLDVLIQTMETLVVQHKKKDIRLVLIGTGQDEQAIRDMIREKHLQDVILLTGEHPNPLEILYQCQAFVLPSRREGLPNVLLEAMSLGLCSLAADCDTGPREVITHEHDGILLPVGGVEELTTAMLHVIDDEDWRSQLGRNAKETVSCLFSVETMMDRYDELLSQLLLK
jgi:glycosyltransferase involved in cell wall biosynthesis